MTKDTAINLEYLRAHHAYGMCRMTIKDENQQNAALAFNALKPVEFYEFIARVSAEKFRHDQELTLAEKIEKTLDLMLPAFKLERVRTDEVEFDSVQSDSDDSVDYKEVDMNKALLPELNKDNEDFY